MNTIIEKLNLRSCLMSGASLFAVMLLGCESDPILAPQNEDTGGGGSYGLVKFDPDDNVKASQNEHPAKSRNPERF